MKRVWSKKSKILVSVLAVLMILQLAGMPAMARSAYESITARFNDIGIYVNNQEITATDENGNEVEPFIYNDSTYVPLRAISEYLGYDVEWDHDNFDVYIGRTQSEEVATNYNTVKEFLFEADTADYADYFTADAVYQYSLGNAGGVDNYLGYEMDAAEWLEGLADDFAYANAYSQWDVTPVFTPVNDAYSNLIMAKVRSTYTDEDGAAVTEYWQLQIHLENGKITKLQAALDLDEENYLAMYATDYFTNTEDLNPETRRAINLHTLDLWWSTRDLPRNVQRRILVTEDATKSMEGEDQIMWVEDENGEYVEGWLDPDQSGAFPQWGFFNEDLTGDPDKIFECADMPDVYLVDAYGNGITLIFGDPLDYQPHYFLQATMRDGLIVNFRELSHGFNRLDR